MPTFDMSLSKAVYLNVKVEADSPEEAEKIIRQRHTAGELNNEKWEQHIPGETAEDFQVDWIEEGAPAPKRYPGFLEI